MTSDQDQDRQRAEQQFKQIERARDGREAVSKYETQARAIRQKTERLRALRLAKEAEAQIVAPPFPSRGPTYAAMMPYSIAVAAFSSFRNLMIRCTGILSERGCWTSSLLQRLSRVALAT